MTTVVSIVLLVIGAISGIVGMVLGHYALSRYRSPSAPKGFSWNPRDWRPVWRTRDWFTEARGYRLYWIASLLDSGGGLVILVVIVFGP